MPADLINTEEIDKMMILADSLRSKISNHELYSSLDGLDKKYNDIRAEFDSNFESKIQNIAKIVTGSTTINNSTEVLSNPNVSGNLIFSEEVITAHGNIL